MGISPSSEVQKAVQALNGSTVESATPKVHHQNNITFATVLYELALANGITPLLDQQQFYLLEKSLRTLYVGNIAQEVTELEIASCFRDYESLEDVWLVLDLETGEHRGFAFVVFDSHKTCEEVLAAEKFHSINGNIVKVQSSKPPKAVAELAKQAGLNDMEGHRTPLLEQMLSAARQQVESMRGLERGGERRDPKNPDGFAGRGPGGPNGLERGSMRQMKNPMVYGPQNFNPMYGGNGFNPQQIAMYGPGRLPPMQQSWNPVMFDGFARTSMAHNNMMGMPQQRAALEEPSSASAPAPARQGAPAGGHQPKRDTSIPLTSDMLAQANPSQQKQMIGERIFPKIQHREPKLAGKITGMLLEMDNMELLHLLENEEALMLKINEALAVLNSHSNDVTEAAAE